jgi:putative transposase
MGRRYVQYFNYTQKRTGILWEGRYKSTLIDSESYLLTCYRYIELNPVRATMVAHPRKYPWSSHLCHAEAKGNKLIAIRDATNKGWVLGNDGFIEKIAAAVSR